MTDKEMEQHFELIERQMFLIESVLDDIRDGVSDWGYRLARQEYRLDQLDIRVSEINRRPR